VSEIDEIVSDIKLKIQTKRESGEYNNNGYESDASGIASPRSTKSGIIFKS
jgi:hypothetical protein